MLTIVAVVILVMLGAALTVLGLLDATSIEPILIELGLMSLAAVLGVGVLTLADAGDDAQAGPS